MYLLRQQYLISIEYVYLHITYALRSTEQCVILRGIAIAKTQKTRALNQIFIQDFVFSLL
jgi:hypothetical protein